MTDFDKLLKLIRENKRHIILEADELGDEDVGDELENVGDELENVGDELGDNKDSIEKLWALQRSALGTLDIKLIKNQLNTILDDALEEASIEGLVSDTGDLEQLYYQYFDKTAKLINLIKYLVANGPSINKSWNNVADLSAEIKEVGDRIESVVAG